MNTTKSFYKFSFILLLFLIPLTADAIHFYVFNKSNKALYIYFKASGCFGISGKHGCKNKKSFHVGKVCSHKYVSPGVMYAHKYNSFNNDFAIYFCEPNQRKSHLFTLTRTKSKNYYIYQNKKGDFFVSTYVM